MLFNSVIKSALYLNVNKGVRVRFRTKNSNEAIGQYYIKFITLPNL